MRPSETIKLRFAEPVPQDVLDLLAKRGWKFTQVTDELFLFESDYVPGASQLPSIEHALRELHWQPKIYHSISPNFESSDFKQAELATVSGPDEYTTELPKQTRKCPACGKPIKPYRLDGRLNKFYSKHFCFVLNGEAFVVNAAFAESLRSSKLSGYELAALDTTGMYFQILATCHLLNQIVETAEMLEYQGVCSSCVWPKFKVFFGPGRILRERYAGEDFVWSSFFGGELLMSHRALDFFRASNASFSPLRPVLLQ